MSLQEKPPDYDLSCVASQLPPNVLTFTKARMVVWPPLLLTALAKHANSNTGTLL